MQTIFFFYGLAFLVLGAVIFLMPKKNDPLGLAGDLWLIGLFGLLHGMNEWVDLFILRGSPFDVGMLTVVGALLLPLSFAPLLKFGVRSLFRGTRSFPSLDHLWVIALAGWAVTCFVTPGFLVPGIVARYFIGFPGAILTAAGLLRSFRKTSREEWPGVVSVGVVVAAVFFIFYGILSGLVVPEADFLWASFLNASNFLQATGIPVQFFRMFCAIVLTASLFAVIGIYRSRDKGDVAVRRGGIKKRIILWLSVTISSVIITISVFGFLMIFKMREQTAGEGLQRDAGLIAASIAQIFNQDMEKLRIYFNDSEWKELLKEKNASYASRSPKEREDYFREMDLKWADPAAVGLEKHLNGAMDVRLENYANAKERTVEIFVTDRYGGLVASSGRTTDFFQADEAWWKDAFNNGKGRETVRDFVWDDSSKAMSIDLAMPVKDEEGRVAGIAKQVISVNSLFEILKDYRVGKTGHALLVNGRGDIISHPEIAPLATQFYSEKKPKEFFVGDRLWTVIFEPHKEQEGVFVASAKVNSSVLEANGISWYVFVEQNKEEIFAPLWHIAFILGGVSGGLLLIFLWVGYILGEKLARPVLQLNRAAQEVRSGNWDYPLDVHSADEIQELAGSFRYMVEHLHQRQKELVKAKEEIESFSKSLEMKVAERTKELSESQRATVNILEDLTETNEKLKKYTENLTRAKNEIEAQAQGLQKANDAIKTLYQELEGKNIDLEKLSRLKDDFVSIVAHELRNPLFVVQEAAALVLDGLAGPIEGEQKKYLTMIKQTGERLIHITNDLLDLAKIEAGKIVVNYEPMDLLSLVRQSCEGIAIRAQKKGIAIVEDFPQGKLEVSGDFDKLSQVMTNLMSNALKFTEKGSITVEVKDLGEEVRCSVKDTGPGISQENISRLFSKFEQFGKAVGSKEKGTGLGLVISKNIIDAHGGRMGVESEIGQGATFFFILPKHQKRKRKLGEILVEDKTLTSEQLAEALRKQKEQKS